MTRDPLTPDEVDELRRAVQIDDVQTRFVWRRGYSVGGDITRLLDERDELRAQLAASEAARARLEQLLVEEQRK